MSEQPARRSRPSGGRNAPAGRPGSRPGGNRSGGPKRTGGQKSPDRGSGGQGSTGRSTSGKAPSGRGPARSGPKSGGRSGARSNERPAGRPPPRTEAERRAAAVRATRAPRAPRDEDVERQRIQERTVETWIDEGSIRSEAEQAAQRAATGGSTASKPTGSGDVDPDIALEISDAVGDRRGERLAERLAAASQALDRERFDEARRMVAPLLREIHGVAAVHEIAGLANYRLGRWKQAANELETARSLKESVELLPVLADSYRALRRWADVERIWNHVKAISPQQEIAAEARIVAAGALGDRGELKAAIEVLESGQKPPKRVRPYHLRQWYALADLYDRGGDTVSATRWFRRVAEHDPQFVDVRERLRALGR
jgi:hypothetical protein